MLGQHLVLDQILKTFMMQWVEVKLSAEIMVTRDVGVKLCCHVCDAAHEAGGAPEQSAPQHVRWGHSESNVAAHGAGHLQQTHQELQRGPPLLLHPKARPVGARQPLSGTFMAKNDWTDTRW